MEDVLKRLGAVESAVSEIKAQVASIASVIGSVMRHLATKADVNALKAPAGRRSGRSPSGGGRPVSRATATAPPHRRRSG